MGNAVRNPARFIEKKIMHEQFGMPDPKNPDKPRPPSMTCDQKRDLCLQAHRDMSLIPTGGFSNVATVIGSSIACEMGRKECIKSERCPPPSTPYKPSKTK